MRWEKIKFDRVTGEQEESILLIEEADLDSNGEVRTRLDDVDEGSAITLSTYQLITSLKNFPKIVNGDVDLSRTQLSSLHGIGFKWLKKCNWLFLPPFIQSNILGLVYIKGLKGVSFEYSNNGFQADPEFTRAMDVINKYIDLGSNDVMECQEDLFEAGLKEYGQL